MAYYKLHAYDADVRINGFTGLNQGEEIARDLSFALEAENVETPRGMLQPQAGMTLMNGEFTGKVETIARFHRRFYDGEGSNEWLVCAAGGYLYCRQANDAIGWVKIQMPESFGTFQSNTWSWVTYEQNIDGVDHPVDVIIMSNKVDGMFMVIPPDRPATWGDLYLGTGDVGYTWDDIKEIIWGFSPEDNGVYSPKWQMVKVNTTVEGETVSTDYRFGVIERFKERVWAADIMSYVTEDNETKAIMLPDKLMYSAVYDPSDWRSYPYEEDGEMVGQPEDGAGDIDQPSWDGDKFTALKRFGDQLIALKGTKVWRVIGTGPADFELQEQYGGGTLFPNTVAVDGERMLMVEKDGLSAYDGMAVNPFQRQAIEKTWRTINRDAMDQMCGCMFKRRYYLSVPTGTSTVNDLLIVFNTEEGSFLTYPQSYIEALMPAGDVLYATSSTTPGKVYEINYNSWETGLSTGKPIRWATPWMDFDFKSLAKGGYEIYFNPEVKGGPVTFKFSIETEKKIKTKAVMIEPTNIKAKQKRIRFGGTSRKFRLIIETMKHKPSIVWRLTGGILMVVETDPD